MSFSRKILVGLASGVLVGLVLGERAGVFRIAADGFVKLLQMTVLPYVTVSIMSSLGRLSYEQARTLGARAGAVLLGLWLVALAFAFVFPLAFPPIESASFFSTTLVERRPPFDFVSLFIPSNPFHSLANNVVPAVVLFSILIGVALIGVERKQVLLDVLAVANQAISRASRLVAQLTPYGIFAIAANAAGTLDVAQIGRIQVYLVTYVAIALLVSLWVLPGLVAAVTPFRYGQVLGPTRDALLTAFIAGDLFIVLPTLTEACKNLVSQLDEGTPHASSLPEVLVPASFNFPHTGKLLSISFVLFAGWFADATVSVAAYPRLALTGLLTFFGSLNAAIPFLLDLFRIPADTFQLFLATGVINSRFGTLVAAVHTVTVGLLGSAAIVGAVRVRTGRLFRYLFVTVVLTVATLGGLRLAFGALLAQGFEGAGIVYGIRPLRPAPEAPLIDAGAAADVVADAGRPVLAAIQARGRLRVGVFTDRLPYAFLNREGRLTGLDVEMAHHLAQDLGVALDFVRLGDRADLPAMLETGALDVVMSGVAATPERASQMLLSEPYLDETLAFVVRDHLRDDFSSWARIRELGAFGVVAPNVKYYLAEVRRRAPSLRVVIEDARVIARGFELTTSDAVILPAESGSVWTLLYPQYSVVVPDSDIVKVPLAYPLARHDLGFASFINTWIELKRRDGTIDALHRHWILGRDAVAQRPRWSVIRDVLHWVN
jgi:Na+/H+-dicarboxylate symporter/ABC-type amino acid transport substrate-binding protein